MINNEDNINLAEIYRTLPSLDISFFNIKRTMILSWKGNK